MNDAIVMTWPKSRPLESYLEELRKAEEQGLTIHFRVPSLPEIPFGARCYMVHDGYVRGWLVTLGFSDGTGVTDPITGEPWPKGKYIVRNPHWTPLEYPKRMKGFRGWRYYSECEYCGDAVGSYICPTADRGIFSCSNYRGK